MIKKQMSEARMTEREIVTDEPREVHRTVR